MKTAKCYYSISNIEEYNDEEKEITSFQPHQAD
jgi:hypothetical protein